jgi:hypothetical protein
MWTIILTDENGLNIELNDVRSDSPGWSECVLGKIKKLSFSFQGIDALSKINNCYELVLEGMSEYNFFVEANKNLLKGKTNILGFWFLGKIPNTNRIIGFVIKDRVLKVNSTVNKEYNGFSSFGWKLGCAGGNVIADIRRI